MMKKVLIVGGNGQLGKAMVTCFNSDYQTFSLDLSVNPTSTHNLLLDQNWLQDSEEYLSSVNSSLSEHQLDSIVCVAGGWAGGNITSPSLMSDMQSQFNINTMSSVLAGQLAARHLKPNGLLVLTGAALPFLEPTPDMLAYSLSKAATHSLAANLASTLLNTTVVTLLPGVIDTESNRINMSEADKSSWVTTNSLSGLVKMWADGNNQPKTGAFAIIKNHQGMAVPEFI